MSKRYPPTALQLNLQRLLVIRLIVFLCQLAALLYAAFSLELQLPYQAIVVIFVLLGLLNGGLYLRLRQNRAPGEREFFIHLLIDVIGLSLLLYLSGGASNPFVSYFLVPVTIAAATLSWAYTVLLALLALACYTLLLYFYLPLEVLMPAGMDMPMHRDSAAPNLHIIGMWFNFLVSAALITWFVVRMAAEIRRQEERLSRYREDTLRNEQILAVATQAAGTAHELGTPLGTMAVILHDLQREHRGNAELKGELDTLQQQVELCRNSLQQLSQQADFRNREQELLDLGMFMRQLLEQWQLLRPELHCDYRQQAGDTPEISVDPTLHQALINILNNAAEASPGGISLELGWNASEWRLRVRDYGAGISRELREQLGTRIVSTKEKGMGVGLVLSQATINRLGGSVSLYPVEGEGTLTEVVLPLLQQQEAGHA